MIEWNIRTQASWLLVLTYIPTAAYLFDYDGDSTFMRTCYYLLHWIAVQNVIAIHKPGFWRAIYQNHCRRFIDNGRMKPQT